MQQEWAAYRFNYPLVIINLNDRHNSKHFYVTGTWKQTLKFQTPLGPRPGVGNQPLYEAPGHVWVENVKTQWLAVGVWGCPLNNNPKLTVG